MDILFENKYVNSEEITKEIYMYCYFKRPIWIAVDVFVVLNFLAGFGYLIFEKSLNFCIFAPIIILWQFYLYRRAVRITSKRIHEIYSEKSTEIQTFVTGENIKMNFSTVAVYEIAYSKFKKAIQTQNLIILFSETNLIYILHKDAFTKGSPEEFISFIKAKGIKIRK